MGIDLYTDDGIIPTIQLDQFNYNTHKNLVGTIPIFRFYTWIQFQFQFDSQYHCICDPCSPLIFFLICSKRQTTNCIAFICLFFVGQQVAAACQAYKPYNYSCHLLLSIYLPLFNSFAFNWQYSHDQTNLCEWKLQETTRLSTLVYFFLCVLFSSLYYV